MQTYINKHWNNSNRSRNYEVTNVCFAVTDSGNPNSENWEQTGEAVPANMDHLYSQGGVRYFGFL